MELALTEDQERQTGRVWGMTFIGVRKKILVWANGLLARLRWPLYITTIHSILKVTTYVRPSNSNTFQFVYG